MGFLADLLCFGLTASAVKTITHNITENIKRKNTVCHFDSDISKEEFYAMVRRSGKKSSVSQTYMQMERWYMVLFVPKVVFLIGILK